MKWNDLSIKEKAEYIKLSVKNNITDLNTIKSIYNKLSEGGFTDNTVVNSNEEKEWLSNWYSSRQDKLTPLYETNPIEQIKENIKNTKEYFPQSYTDIGGDVIKEYAFDKELNSRKQNYYSIVNNENVETILGSQDNYNNYLNERRNIIRESRNNNLSREDTNKKLQDLLNTKLESQIPFEEARKIAFQGIAFPEQSKVVYSNYTPSVAIHELNHAVSGNNNLKAPIEESIKSKLKYREGINNKDYYLDNADEVYSRMMQIRHDAGIRPTDVIDNTYLNKIRDNKLIKNNKYLIDDFMNRYSDDSLIDLFNNVAMNDAYLNPNTSVNISSMGGFINTDKVADVAGKGYSVFDSADDVYEIGEKIDYFNRKKPKLIFEPFSK